MATCASSTIKIVAKEKTVSPIWTYFGLEAYDDGKPISKDNAICRLCETPVPSKGGSTSNMFSHFKCHHPKKYAELTQTIAANKLSSSNKWLSSKPSSSGPQPTILEVMNKSKQYEKNGKKWQALTDSITRCLCKDMLFSLNSQRSIFVYLHQVLCQKEYLVPQDILFPNVENVLSLKK